jgi:hypothetical protein
VDGTGFATFWWRQPESRALDAEPASPGNTTTARFTGTAGRPQLAEPGRRNLRHAANVREAAAPLGPLRPSATFRRCRTARGRPGIDDGHVKTFEVSRIAGRDRGASRLRNSSNQGVTKVGGSASVLAIGSEASSGGRSWRVEVQDSVLKVFFENVLEGCLESEPLSASW